MIRAFLVKFTTGYVMVRVNVVVAVVLPLVPLMVIV
jgi:hypothetical protein